MQPLPNGAARLRVSLYADDAIIFANPSREEVDILLEILKLFGDTTELCINQQKCSAIPIRCADVDLDHVLQNFGGGRAGFPFRYLGLPVSTTRTRLVHLQFILDRIQARLAGWKGRLISLAGR